MNTEMTVDSGYKTLPLSMLEESSTNPRRTFEPSRLIELAQSITVHGLIQPITVRPKGGIFEVVAGARRYRAAQIAELSNVPVRILDLSDEQTLEVQIIENSQRENVHPYEEAAGYQRLLDLPGYSVEALVQKTGRSQSHIYARLTLLALIPEVAEAFQEERITASHANLIARLPADRQAEAFEQCWRKDYQDKEPHLLPAKNVAAWIQANLYLALAAAPFDREDPSLNPAAGACTTCPRRSGYNTSLFCDVQGDQCLDSACYNAKIASHLDREITARPGLVQIEEGWRRPTEQKPGSVRRGFYREIETTLDNPDAEPVSPCDAAKPALIVFGQHLGRFLTVCTDIRCPVHDPRQAQGRATNPRPTVAPATEDETEEQTAARKADYEQRQAEYRAEQERKEAARQAEEERVAEEYRADQERRTKQQKKRAAAFERIIHNAPPVFSAGHLRMLLRALVNMDPYTFADDLAVELNGDDENDQRSAEEVLLTTIDSLADDKLTGFALHLALAGHRGIPKEGEADYLAEAETAFVPSGKVTPAKKTAKKMALVQNSQKPTTPKKPTKKTTKAA